MIIISLVSGEQGWNPISYMTILAAELLEADVITIDTSRPSALKQLWSIVHGRNRAGSGGESCLMICATPTGLALFSNISGWRRRFKFLAAWVIDSFWLDWIPSAVRISKPFDHFFVTTAEDVDDWRAVTGTSTSWLAWGTDALRLGGNLSARPWDLLRVGRQPPEWDDDAVSSQAASQLGISFHPRPSAFTRTPLENQKTLMSLYGQAKFLLAFSNQANPTNYTHPKRQYLTGRWVDGLACGTVVAGIAPNEPSIDKLLWPGATLDLGGIGREAGLRVIHEALSSWTPADAARNHALALERLDWRWRFKVIADMFGEAPERLHHELGMIASTSGRAGAAA